MSGNVTWANASVGEFDDLSANGFGKRASIDEESTKLVDSTRGYKTM